MILYFLGSNDFEANFVSAPPPVDVGSITVGGFTYDYISGGISLGGADGSPGQFTNVIWHDGYYPIDAHSLELTVAALGPSTLHYFPPGSDAVIVGSDVNNLITGTSGNDTIDGGGGDNIAAYSQPAQQYTVSTNGNVITVEDRSGHDGTDTLTNIQHLEFQGSRLDTTPLTKAATLPQDQMGSLTELYVAYFNRAPDALGLDYWASRMVDGMSLAQIAKSFFAQPEASASFPTGTTAEAFVTKVYQNVLGRAPDQAGLAYWVNDLNKGNVTPDVLVLAVINGAKSATGGAADAQYLANKEAVGVHFALDKGLTDGAWGTQVMAHVDGTADSVAAANQMTDVFAQQAVTTDPHLLLPLVGVHPDTTVS
jgi:hypothetical protein